jgi:hypothetical protein
MRSYVRWEGTVRETGTRVQLLDLTHPESEYGGGGDRWATVCLDHAGFATWSNSELAWAAAAHPRRWCDKCAKVATIVLRTRDGEQRVELDLPDGKHNTRKVRTQSDIKHTVDLFSARAAARGYEVHNRVKT